jgi:hypothetical protein
VTSLYDLMDMGYVNSEIREHSIGLRHVPLTSRRKNEGAAKVMAYLMFGVLAMTADQLIRWISPPANESDPVAL